MVAVVVAKNPDAVFIVQGKTVSNPMWNILRWSGQRYNEFDGILAIFYGKSMPVKVKKGG